MDTPRSALRFPDGARGALALALLTLILIAGCTDVHGNDPNVPDKEGAFTADSAPQVTCVGALPSSCPQAPSYALDIAPLAKRTCLPCHSRGGVASDRDLSTYKNLTRIETTAFVQINGCLMPPADAGPDAAMSHAERTEFLQWFVCGAPNN